MSNTLKTPAVAAHIPVHRDESAPQGYGRGEENQSFTTVYQCWNLLFWKFCQLALKFISTVCWRLRSFLAAVLACTGGQTSKFNYFYSSSCHCCLHHNWSPMSCLLSRTSGYPFSSSMTWVYSQPGFCSAMDHTQGLDSHFHHQSLKSNTFVEHHLLLNS